MHRLSLLFAALLLAGCSSSGSSDPAPAPSASADPNAPTVSCENDPRVDTYVANLAKTTPNGMKITLVSSAPAPPIRGTNDWVLKVEGAQGDLTVTPFMPDHGHGTSVKPTIESTGPGAYTIKNLYFFMPGVWRVTVGTASDSAAFHFCVAG